VGREEGKKRANGGKRVGGRKEGKRIKKIRRGNRFQWGRGVWELRREGNQIDKAR